MSRLLLHRQLLHSEVVFHTRQRYAFQIREGTLTALVLLGPELVWGLLVFVGEREVSRVHV